MRYITISFLLLLSGCKATSIHRQSDPPQAFVICIEYNHQEQEEDVLHALNQVASIQYFDILYHDYRGILVASCEYFTDVTMDLIEKQLGKTPGVLHITVNPVF